jgi:hypothetical protein
MLLYVGRDGDVEPQTLSITAVHLGEVVVTSLWDVTPCGVVDRCSQITVLRHLCVWAAPIQPGV